MVEKVLGGAVGGRQVVVALLHQHPHVRILRHGIGQIHGGVGNWRVAQARRGVPPVPVHVQAGGTHVGAIGFYAQDLAIIVVEGGQKSRPHRGEERIVAEGFRVVRNRIADKA